MNDQSPARPSKHHIWRVFVRTITKAWKDSILAESAKAAFWQVLSLPPLLLGLIGSLVYIAPLFGPDTLITIENRLISAAGHFFSPSVVNQIITPTIWDVVKGARKTVVSLGFVMSMWAGSSAISAFVDSVCKAHGQTKLRHPVRQRFVAVGIYIGMLVIAVVLLPVIALGPQEIGKLIPKSLAHVLQYGYYPVLGLSVVVLITALYRVALPRPLPSHRLVLGAVLATVVFLTASFGLRIYLRWITSWSYTYGALASPIAFLLFAFMLGFAIVIGAELNNAIQEQWPTHARRFRSRLTPRIGNQRGGEPANEPAATVSPS